MDTLREVWKRKGAEVVIQDTMPPEIVCECGSMSTPRAVKRADQIAKFPDVLRFLEKLFSEVELHERVGHKEVRFRTTWQSFDRLIKELEAVEIDPKFHVRNIREKANAE